MFGMDRTAVVTTLETFRQKPFIFHRYSQNALQNANAGEEYGNAFIHPDYIYEKWKIEDLTVQQHLAGGLRGWQDIVILEKKK